MIKVYSVLLRVCIPFIILTWSTIDTDAQIDPKRIDIVRDSFGVPHIFAATDAEVSYGLAYAYCEDDFNSLQEVFLPAKGLMGKVRGKTGAAGDFAFELFRCRDITEEKWHTLTPSFLQLIEGYVQGVNDYARLHPQEVLHPHLFPLTIKEYIASSVLALTIFNGADKPLISLFNNQLSLADFSDKGSNSMAIHPKKSATGEALLVVNAHQPNTGSQAFYEAHIHSQQGLNVLGGLLAGGPVILHGVNEHLGWAHTVNYCDRTDIFQLQINPDNEDQYMFDGKWETLEKRKISLHIKGIPIPIKKYVYWSRYGATMKNKQGCFAIRLGANMIIGALQQWYYMNKAKNFTEFYQALERQELSMFNIMYADRYDTIFYINNALMPIRNESYNWRSTLPGNTSKTLWQDFYPIKELPQYVNPASHYLFNTNHSSFYATDQAYCLSPLSYSKTSGWELYHNNRSKRFLELLPSGLVSLDTLKKIKEDKQYPSSFHFVNLSIDSLYAIKPAEYAGLQTIVTTLQNWNLRGDVDSEGAALFFLLQKNLVNEIPATRKVYSIPDIISALDKVNRFLLSNFGTTKITLGQLQRLVRGKQDYPLGGLIDMLAPQWTKPYKNSTFQSVGGDGYMMYIRFPENQLPVIETVNMYGASSHPQSKHFTDQVPLYLANRTKMMSLNKDIVYQLAERIYHPGD
jgi:acyl-homoserine-lactone acylase